MKGAQAPLNKLGDARSEGMEIGPGRRNGQTSSILVTWLLVVLLVVGVSEPLGVFLSMPRLRAFGRLTSASNSPLVFNQVAGIEFWANRYTFELIGRDGSVVDIPVTNRVVMGIRGPHTRTAAYVVPVGLSTFAPPVFYRPPLVYGLCDHGPLARDLDYHGDLAVATIRIESGSPGDHRKWTVEIPCDR